MPMSARKCWRSFPRWAARQFWQIGVPDYGLRFGIQGLNYESHEVSPRWTYADTVSWTRGAHAFKFGGEYRLSSTKSTLGGSVQGTPTVQLPRSVTRAWPQSTGIARTGLAGTATTGNQQVAENMLTWLSGSLSSLVQARFINDLSGTWNDFATDPLKIRDIAQNEIGTFFKDDWKVTRDLTLNLGVRWDYYGVPWERNGLTTALNGGGHRLFGVSGRQFRRLDETWRARRPDGDHLCGAEFTQSRPENL